MFLCALVNGVVTCVWVIERLEVKVIDIFPHFQSQAPPPKKTEAEIKEEEELQLALAISQSEAEAEKENQKKKSTTKLLNTSTPASSTGPPPVSIAAPPEDLDPELVRYLDRNYWEQKEKEKAKAKSSGETVAVTDIKKSITITEETSPSKSGEHIYSMEKNIGFFI